MTKRKPRPAKVLTEKQQRYVNEYVVDCNQGQAALRAGYGGGTNLNTAHTQASRLMAIPEIRRAIDQKLNKLAAKTETSSEWVRRRLKEEAEDFSKGSSPAARVRAAELIGKLNGDFVEDRRNLRSPLSDFDTADLEQLEKALADVPSGPDDRPSGTTTH